MKATKPYVPAMVFIMRYIMALIPKVWLFKWKLLSSTVVWCCLFFEHVLRVNLEILGRCSFPGRGECVINIAICSGAWSLSGVDLFVEMLNFFFVLLLFFSLFLYYLKHWAYYYPARLFSSVFDQSTKNYNLKSTTNSWFEEKFENLTKSSRETYLSSFPLRQASKKLRK